MEKDYRQQTGKLKSQREGFARSNKDEQSKMAPAIRDLEKRVLQMSEELDKQAIEVRNAEKTKLKITNYGCTDHHCTDSRRSNTLF